MSMIQPFIPKVRYINGLMIYWRDRHSIIISKGLTCVIFHRWYDTKRGRYSEWRKFSMRLRRRNTWESIYQIIEVANTYDIDHQTVTRTIKCKPPVGVKVLPEVYDWKNEKHRHLH